MDDLPDNQRITQTTPVRVRADQYNHGKNSRRGFRATHRKPPRDLVAEAVYVLSLDNASFHHDKTEDARIKEAVRLYLETYAIPPLSYAFDKLTRKSDRPEQLPCFP